jgi:integrase
MTMPGNITRRGRNSWRLKFEAGGCDPLTGKRRTGYVTVRGTKKKAQAELIRLLATVENRTVVEPSKVTLTDYVRAWLDGSTHLAPKTMERYRELAECQIIPYLGNLPLQKLRPLQISDWHGKLLRSGGRNGRPLSARTVGHAHRVLHAALAQAAKLEATARNVASVVTPPKVDAAEIECLDQAQIKAVLVALRDDPLRSIVTIALTTGMRRGELCALQWRQIDLDAATIDVERSLEQTNHGLRVKPPKSRHGRRCISLPVSAIETLRTHRLRQTELRLALGLGRLGPEDLVFCLEDGSPLPPDRLSQQWRRAADRHGLPPVTFHAFRHTHASALIAAGLDIVTVSRRLGHGSPGITLGIYAHKFTNTDTAAAAAIDAAMGAS